MNPAAACAGWKPDEQRLIRELFHDLNQPLTSLQCSLELSLQRPRSSEEYRLTMRRALDQAQEIARLACGIRDFLEAAEPQLEAQASVLDAYLREAITDLQPLAESKQVGLVLEGTLGAEVRVEAQRLRRILFSLLGWALEHASAGDGVTVHAQENEEEAIVRIAWGESQTAWDESALTFSIARRLAEATGGALSVSRDHGEICMELHLLLVSPACLVRP